MMDSSRECVLVTGGLERQGNEHLTRSYLGKYVVTCLLDEVGKRTGEMPGGKRGSR